jgi:chromate transporter
LLKSSPNLNSLRAVTETGKNRISLVYTFFTFLKIGATSFGGFMALISVVQDKLVEKDKMIRNEVILDGISLSSVLPGPVAVNVVTYIGYQIRGFRGAILSMIAVILPSFLLILLLAFLYFQYYDIPAFDSIMGGIMPAVSAIIISTGFNMSKKSIKGYKQILICILSGLIFYLISGIYVTIGVIIIAGTAGYFLFSVAKNEKKSEILSSLISDLEDLFLKNWKTVLIFFVILASLIVLPEFIDVFKQLRAIFFTFGGMSLTLFGGGYVFIPVIQEIVVNELQWLSNKEFVDAIAMGQITPGPILISATFIGYKIAGFWGALVATVAIFMPSGLLMIVCARFFSIIRDSEFIKSAFMGIRPAVIGMIFVAALTIAKQIEWQWPSILIFVIVLILSIKYHFKVIYLIPLSGILGWLLI